MSAGVFGRGGGGTPVLEGGDEMSQLAVGEGHGARAEEERHILVASETTGVELRKGISEVWLVGERVSVDLVADFCC